jgi:hypothetical protein
MQSLGRVGRILSGSLESGTIGSNKDSAVVAHGQQVELSLLNAKNEVSINQKTSIKIKTDDNQSQNSINSLIMSKHTVLQEPDVIASTKLSHSKTTDSVCKTKT